MTIEKCRSAAPYAVRVRKVPTDCFRRGCGLYGCFPQSRSIACHGVIQIDAAQMRVWVDGTEVPIRPRQFMVLTALAELPGRTVRRSHLLATAWGSGFLGYDHALDEAVCRLRAAIGDRSIIETIPKCGYRLRGDLDIRVC
jgi:DNA-binding response OmpR family regulator